MNATTNSNAAFALDWVSEICMNPLIPKTTTNAAGNWFMRTVEEIASRFLQSEFLCDGRTNYLFSTNQFFCFRVTRPIWHAVRVKHWLCSAPVDNMSDKTELLTVIWRLKNTQFHTTKAVVLLKTIGLSCYLLVLDWCVKTSVYIEQPRVVLFSQTVIASVPNVREAPVQTLTDWDQI